MELRYLRLVILLMKVTIKLMNMSVIENKTCKKYRQTSSTSWNILNCFKFRIY